jgi:2-polyprenyl-6-methoxyphenol hydroxylase-like FAD-dependent oxidoreductase
MTSAKNKIGARAIIVGAGIGGLAAAAAVAPFFKEVAVLERDELPGVPRARKAVGQGQHLHILLKGGELFLEDLLPGTRDKLLALGASEVKQVENSRIFERGHWYPKRDLGFSLLGLSRPAYEHVVRQQVRGLPNVAVRDRTSVESLVIENGRVVGVGVLDADGERTERADLLVVACGRGSFLESALLKAGLAPVPSTRLAIEVHYASGRFAKPERFKGEQVFFMCQPKPPESKLAFLTPVENDEWVVALGGRFDKKPPTELEAFRAYASALPISEIAERIRDAKLVEPLKAYRMNTASWHHYDRCADLPQRLVPLGDSISSFNPTFGQGMSVAAGHAVALRDALARMSAAKQDLAALPGEYFPRVMKLTEQAWAGAATVDMEYEQTVGERPPDYQKILAWVEAMRCAARRHPEVQKLRLEIGHLLKPPTASREGPVAALIAAELPKAG